MNAAQFARKLALIEHKGRGRKGFAERATRALAREQGVAAIVAAGKVVGYRMTTGEAVCVKDRYPDHETAVHHLESMAASAVDNPHRVPVRAYPCDACKGWHVTSMKNH